MYGTVVAGGVSVELTGGMSADGGCRQAGVGVLQAWCYTPIGAYTAPLTSRRIYTKRSTKKNLKSHQQSLVITRSGRPGQSPFQRNTQHHSTLTVRVIPCEARWLLCPRYRHRKRRRLCHVQRDYDTVQGPSGKPKLIE